MKPNRMQEIFRTRVRAEMKANGMTQVELAIRSECSEPAISHYLDGDPNKARVPRVDAAARIATALGVSVDYLFGLTDERRPWEVPSAPSKEVFSAPRMEVATDGRKQPCSFRFNMRGDNITSINPCNIVGVDPGSVEIITEEFLLRDARDMFTKKEAEVATDAR